LGIAGFVSKIIGVLFRVPLAWIVGESGVGTYQLVFPTYSLLLTISSRAAGGHFPNGGALPGQG
jgi:stage V sporulation protein B